jgi:hypothetical protein
MTSTIAVIPALPGWRNVWLTDDGHPRDTGANDAGLRIEALPAWLLQEELELDAGDISPATRVIAATLTEGRLAPIDHLDDYAHYCILSPDEAEPTVDEVAGEVTAYRSLRAGDR